MVDDVDTWLMANSMVNYVLEGWDGNVDVGKDNVTDTDTVKIEFFKALPPLEPNVRVTAPSQRRYFQI